MNKLKEAMLKWRDFYGQDLADTDAIMQAKSRKELREILNNHKYFLELQNSDALKHVEGFIDKMGLTFID